MVPENTLLEAQTREVADVTGISRATLTCIANQPGYNCNTDAINALCKYFACTPCELLDYIKDEEAEG